MGFSLLERYSLLLFWWGVGYRKNVREMEVDSRLPQLGKASLKRLSRDEFHGSKYQTDPGHYLLVKDLRPLKDLYFNTQSQDFTLCVHSGLFLSLDKEPTPTRNAEPFLSVAHLLVPSVHLGSVFRVS